MRISGFASGMDIDSMVKQLMAAKRAPLDKLNQKTTTLQWQQEQYRDINIKLLTFRNSKLLSYSSSASLDAKQASVSGNTSAVTVTAGSTAPAGALSIEVDNLATAASISSGSNLGSAPLNMNSKLIDLKNSVPPVLNYDSQSVEINGTQISFDENTDTLGTLISKINSNSGANVNVYLDNVTGRMSITSKTTGAASTVTLGGSAGNILTNFGLGSTNSVAGAKLSSGSSSMAASGALPVDTSKTLTDLKAAGTITYDSSNAIVINGKSISFDENTDTLSSLITKINSDPAANVTATFDAATGKMSLTSKTASAISLAGNASGNLLESFNLQSSSASYFTTGAVSAGVDANVKINGIATTRSSNRFTENGIDITLNSKTNGIASTINVVSNTDKIVDTIKSFITDYNDLLSTINGKLGEDRYPKYTPLSDDQKKEMSDDQVKLWESKAKSGLLLRDSTLTQLANNMRLTVMTNVNMSKSEVAIDDSDQSTTEVEVNLLGSFGISTGDWTTQGKLMLTDESKLRAAIEADPNKVISFFTRQSTETDPTVKNSPTDTSSGLFNRLSNSALTAINLLAQKAGTSKYSTDPNTGFSATSLIGTQLMDLADRINDMNERLTREETNYYQMFTNMETAMNRYQSQSSSLFGAQ
ncbi:flagellar filament capping protein FliD [Paenibacillus albus]|uniref:Flagellar hook-associated protein 2 n=1 Tax=Paenibacillus albus TaxID=2495582 RepID=A0A3S8ZYE9_9BACL|nr:flagellar filament capping protein FliD [Paenibacillus albus]AZN38521.1 hypothetical protein EJC50_01670 [Paenibacillus albus]